jgi:hypothetical protein
MKNTNKIYVLYKGNGPDNGQKQYIAESIGWTNDWKFACLWSKNNKGYYGPLLKIK